MTTPFPTPPPVDVTDVALAQQTAAAAINLRFPAPVVVAAVRYAGALAAEDINRASAVAHATVDDGTAVTLGALAEAVGQHVVAAAVQGTRPFDRATYALADVGLWAEAVRIAHELVVDGRDPVPGEIAELAAEAAQLAGVPADDALARLLDSAYLHHLETLGVDVELLLDDSEAAPPTTIGPTGADHARQRR